MSRLNSKLKNQNGISVVILILLIAIIILSVLIIIPIATNANESAREQIDLDYEQTATDSAYMKYMADGTGFTAIYDSEKKEFIDEVGSAREFGSITAYGESKNHKDKVILVSVSDSGDIDITWIGVSEYRKVNK